MDDLYHNLDNYHEETTIAELREENKDLKLKLQDYASTLEKLQNEFDILAGKHKQMETNFSALLTTAKGEIERKTQIITKLNIEKDAMVLNSIQNRGTPFNRRRNKHNFNQGTGFSKPAVLRNENKKPIVSNQVSNERSSGGSLTIENVNTPNIDTNISNPPIRTNLQTRLLDMVNKNSGSSSMNTKNNEVKENIYKKGPPKICAKIGNRRKSMPAFSMDCAQFSPDEDEVASTGSGKELMPREQEESANRLPNIPNNDKRMSGYSEAPRDLRSKLNMYDGDKYKCQEKYDSQRFKRNHSPHRFNNYSERRVSPDRRRNSPERQKVSTERKRSSPERRRLSPGRRRVSPDRRRVSPDRRRMSPERRKITPDWRRVSPGRRRGSPNRFKKGSRDHSEEMYQKKEYDRHRRLVSPPKDKYHQRPHEVSEHQEFDKYKTHCQDRYTVKHKMPYDYEEPSKRKKLESYYKVEDRRNIAEPDFSYLHHMSCQSPEYNSLEAQPSHQIREIKLNATSELEDPRKSSNRYLLKKHFGESMLTSVENADIDLKVIDTSGWDLIKMKIPDALLQKPDYSIMSSDLLQKPLPSMHHSLSENSVSPGIPHAATKPWSTDETHTAKILTSPDMPLVNESSSFNTPIALPKSHTLDTPLIHQKTLAKTPEESVKEDSATQIQSDVLSDVQPKKPLSTFDIVNEIYMDLDNPVSNISMESGEIYDDLEVQPSQNLAQKLAEKTVQQVESQNAQENTEELKTYRIPKKNSNKQHTNEISKDINPGTLTSDKEHNPNPNSYNSTKRNNSNKASTIELRKQGSENSFTQSNISQRRSNNIQNKLKKYSITKEIIEDFELSDETSDNTEIQISKQTTILPVKLELKSPELSKEHPKPNSEKTSKETALHKKPKPKKKSIKLEETRTLPELKDPILSKNKHRQIENSSSIEQDVSLSMDQLVQLRTDLTKELENEDTPLFSEKSVKKKESKTKTPPGIKVSDVHNDKSVKKKEAKSKEAKPKTKVTSVSKDAPAADQPFKNEENKQDPPEAKNTHKQGKKKQKVSESDIASTVDNKDTINDKATVTKFDELFGDSSSLISPEDLGLVPTVTPQENYVTMFEDAQDATDIVSIKAAAPFTLTANKNKIVDMQPTTNFSMNINSVVTPVISDQSIQPIQDSVTKESVVSVTSVQNIYQNLQPEIPEKQNDTVKTVIISSGIQPDFVSRDIEPNCIAIDRSEDLHVMQCVKPTILQGIGMQALATSTPHKLWQHNVVPLDCMPSNSKGTLQERRDASVDKTPTIYNSDNNTNNSQVNAADEPDMKIFVKRRRKVVKKK